MFTKRSLAAYECKRDKLGERILFGLMWFWFGVWGIVGLYGWATRVGQVKVLP